MRWSFVFKHWFFTLLAGPIAAEFLSYIFSGFSGSGLGLFELYLVVLLFSIGFSAPTLIVYIAAFIILQDRNLEIRFSKFILITLAILGIIITALSLGGELFSNNISLIAGYLLAAILIGSILSLKEPNTASKNGARFQIGKKVDDSSSS